MIGKEIWIFLFFYSFELVVELLASLFDTRRILVGGLGMREREMYKVFCEHRSDDKLD